jgi:hypothetical protein
MNKQILKRLIEKEKILYLEVEQLRSHLYLHDSSLIFEFFSAFYFAFQDVKKLFTKKIREQSPIVTKKESISSLVRKKTYLRILEKTPYAWILFGIRTIRLLFSQKKQSTQEKELTLIFGTTDIQDSQSRSISLTQALTKKNKSIYIEGVFDVGRKPGFRITQETQKITAVRLVSSQAFHLHYQYPSPKEIVFLKKSLRKFTQSMGNHHKATYYIHHPFWQHIASPKKNLFYFDNAYDFAHLKNAPLPLIASEKKLIKNALVLTAPHPKLLRNKKDILLRNGVDWNIFKDTSKMIQTCDVGLCWIKKPVMGFIGTMDERFDEILLGKIAAAFPTASIVLVGNTDYRPVIEVAEQHQNIFPVGKQPYAKLPLFLQSFDILITPYKSFPNAIADHPELPLYLASGKPVLHTPGVCKGRLQPYGKFIYYPKTHAEWVLAVAEALKEKRRSKKRNLRIATAKKLKWTAKGLAI